MKVNMSSDATSATIFHQSSNDPVSVAVLKKALEVEAKNAKALIAAVPQATKNVGNLPSNLGRNINTTA